MIWLTSDTHFRHRNILEYCGRPYFSMKHMEEKLIRNWNSKVGESDVVYVLGDFTLNHKYHAEIVPRLIGTKILILGNHDKGGPGCGSRKWFDKMKPIYLSYGWDDVLLNTKLNHPDLGIVHLNHFPVKGGGDHGEERYTDYRLPENTKNVLCGHVHTGFIKRGNCVNVGVDVHNYAPISFFEACELLQHEGDIDAPFSIKRKAFALFHKIKNRLKGIKPFRLSSKKRGSDSSRSRRGSRKR